MSMFNDIFCDRYDNKDECLRNANIVKTFAGRFGIGQWSFFGPGSEKSGVPPRTVHKEPGTILRKKCCWNSHKAHILSSVQRLHCPEVFSKAKDVESCRYTSLQMNTQLIQFFALSFLSISSVSTEQWQLYARNLRTIKIERVLGEVKEETLVHDEDPKNDQLIRQQYIQQIGSLSPENRLSKFCEEL